MAALSAAQINKTRSISKSPCHRVLGEAAAERNPPVSIGKRWCCGRKDQHQNWVLEVPGVGPPKQKGVGSGRRGMWGLVSWIPARRIHGAKAARPGRSQPPKVFRVS